MQQRELGKSGLHISTHQGSLIASLGVSVSHEQADAVWAIAARLDESLAAL